MREECKISVVGIVLLCIDSQNGKVEWSLFTEQFAKLWFINEYTVK